MRVCAAAGGNLYELEGERQTSAKEPRRALYFLPKRLRHIVYIRRGSFVIAKNNDEAYGKVVGEITAALLDEHIKTMKKTEDWPECFTEAKDFVTAESSTVQSDLNDLQNPNRRQWELNESSSSDDED